MSYTITIPHLPGEMQITCTAETQKEAIREAHFWQSLPTYCPIDGSATVFCYREPNDNSYYSVISTGWPVFEYKIGQHKTGGTLFAKEEWVIFDGEKETVLWSRGQLTPAGKQQVANSAQHIATSRQELPPPASPAREATPPPARQEQPPAPKSAAAEEFGAIPGKDGSGDVPKVTAHQLQRIKEEATRIYGPDYPEAKLAGWISKDSTAEFAKLNFTEAKELLDALLRRASQPSQQKAA